MSWCDRQCRDIRNSHTAEYIAGKLNDKNPSNDIISPEKIVIVEFAHVWDPDSLDTIESLAGTFEWTHGNTQDPCFASPQPR